MFTSNPKNLIYCLAILLLWGAVGCAGPLTIEYAPPKPPDAPIAGAGTILISAFTDTRTTESPQHMGTIASPVSGLHGDTIILDRAVADFVTEAVQSELTDAGFNVTSWTTGDGAHDWKGHLLKGKVKRFNLAIGPRDEIAIEIESRVVDVESGKVLWEKSVALEDDRYAGVMGNSRRSIGLYTSHTLSRVLRETIADLSANLPAEQPATPVTVKSGVEAEIPTTDIVEKSRQGEKGRLVITTEPPRAKLYIEDIYYGLTPIEIEIEPGILTITLRRKGYEPVGERVSVRPGALTEMEIEMEAAGGRGE